MAKDNEQQTMEEYLLSQLDTPVVLKDGTMMTKPDGSPMTKQEAIATNILNLAMKGDVKAAQYIQNIQMRAKIEHSDAGEDHEEEVTTGLGSAAWPVDAAGGWQGAGGLNVSKLSIWTFERSRQTGSGVSLRAKRTRITRISLIYLNILADCLEVWR